MKRAAILLVLLLPAQAASLWALPNCAPAAVCHMGPDGESCCPAGECSMQECDKPDADIFLAPAVSLPPPASVELPRLVFAGRVVFEIPIASSCPAPEILDPPPRA
jgi:hypothetical protein